MFEFTSPRKLGSVNSNMNSGVLEAESVKFSPFSGELHLKLGIAIYKTKDIMTSRLLEMYVMIKENRTNESKDEKFPLKR